MAEERRLAETRMIRTPAAGPEPCNTLVFLSCRVPGLDVPVSDDAVMRATIRMQTTFRIDGYLQSQYEWYIDNTQVSATASLKMTNTTTDLSFLFAVDSVTPVLSEFDGSLGFDVRLAARMQDDAIFGGAEIAQTVALSAYVLCYEPRAAMPPPGDHRSKWAVAVMQGPTISEIRASHARRKQAGAARRPGPCDG